MRPRADPPPVGPRRFGGLAQERIHARRRHDRLLQHGELHRDLHERLDHPRDVGDEGVEEPHLHDLHALGAHRDHDDRDEHDVEEVERGPQQPRIGAQRPAARLVVLLVGAREARGETADRARGLQHAHAGDAFGHLRIDVAAQLPHARHRRRGQPLVGPHDRRRGGYEQQHDEHQAPVEPEHRDHHAEEHGHAHEHLEEHLRVELLDRLGVVGDARHELPRDRAVEEAHRHAQHVRVHVLAQPLHRARGQAREPHELQVAHDARQRGAGERGADEERDHRKVGHARNEMVVDQALAEERCRRLQQPRHDEPRGGAYPLAAIGQRGPPQEAQRRHAIHRPRGARRLAGQIVGGGGHADSSAASSCW